ncbi:hypothetical protein Smar_0982 [Staphylothermus marinus F1]|uniref:Flagellar biosynthesis protein FlaG n=1 Tax=Staphylothermus marinus (strain ATCC 43588 / DSM 3639 / JCM 9404 / F1) TaxID=399550 RepID=A3DN71_STAMF|nr:hypothetical protein [Staphylothermus marinus]ABN70081.1 hypothetical protein Smar_0982 [Staphylothermus marinus F1]
MNAISPLIAAALLLIITVAGGVIIYNYVMNTLQAPQQFASITVLSAKMLVDNGQTILNIKATNIGTTSAKITGVRILPDNLSVNTDVTIEPGVTKSINLYINQTLDTTTNHYVIIEYDNGETEPVMINIIK